MPSDIGVELRHFHAGDAELVRFRLCPEGTTEDALALIRAWETKQHDGHYFEMFAVCAHDAVVGTASLYHRSPSVVSLGVEIFPEFRRRGYAHAAMGEALDAAKTHGYSIAMDQVAADNAASIALHNKLGFENDGYPYKNRKGKDVLIFLKPVK